MPKPGARVPTLGIPIVLTGTDANMPRMDALRCAITTAGTLIVSYVDSPGAECILDFPVEGVYVEVGDLALARLGTAVGTFVILNS